MAEPEPKRRVPRWKAVLMWGALAAILAGAFFVLWVIHWLLHPWTVSLPGKPGLVGYWQGEVPFAPDDTRRIVITLEANPPAGRDTLIEGTAKVCGGPHRMTYDIDGDAYNRSGTRFWMNPSVDDYGTGVYLYRIKGEWDLADLVTVDATLATFPSSSDSPERPVRFQLHRSTEDEFDATCH